MAVDPAKAHRGNTRSQRGPRVARGSGTNGIEVLGLPGKHLMRVVAARGRRNHAPVDASDRFEQAADAGRGLGMSDEGLERRHAALVRLRLAKGVDRTGDAGELDRVADRGASSVTLDEVQRVRRVPCAIVRAPQGQGLAVHGRCGDAALSVRRDAPTVQDRVDVVTVPFGIIQPLHDDEAAALTGKKTVSCAVVDFHVRVGQRTHFGEPYELERVEADVDAARQRDIDVAGAQRVRRGRHGEQRRRARAIHCVSATPKIHVVADATGNRVG